MDTELDAATLDAVTLFSLLGHPIRLATVRALLDEGELTVRDLIERVPGSDNSLSQHLSKMRLAKLVSSRRTGTTYVYAVTNDRVAGVVAAALAGGGR